jgi:hypothetical protein
VAIDGGSEPHINLCAYFQFWGAILTKTETAKNFPCPSKNKMLRKCLQQFLDSYMPSDILREISNVISEYLLIVFVNTPLDLHGI